MIGLLIRIIITVLMVGGLAIAARKLIIYSHGVNTAQLSYTLTMQSLKSHFNIGHYGLGKLFCMHPK